MRIGSASAFTVAAIGPDAHAAQLPPRAGHRHFELDALLVAFFEQVMRVIGHVEIRGEIGRLEQRPELLRRHLGFRRVHLRAARAR